jgi:hypothetical protein
VALQKVATPEQKKGFCVLQFAKKESIVSLQRAFLRQFQSVPISANSIKLSYQQFQTRGRLCEGESVGRPHMSEEILERVTQYLIRSPKESVVRANRGLEMQTMTVWRVF